MSEITTRDQEIADQFCLMWCGSYDAARQSLAKLLADRREDGMIRGRYEGAINYAANTGKFDHWK